MSKLKEVMLILTEGCNLTCSYCFEHCKTNKRMNFETAKQIIDAEMSLEDGTNECRFTMFGGEPFLEIELIKQIYNYIESNIQSWNRKVMIFVNTNGTLTDEKTKGWLSRNSENFHSQPS